jgi:hypothetical protein
VAKEMTEKRDHRTRLQVVQQVVLEGKSLHTVEDELGISIRLLATWCLEFRELALREIGMSQTPSQVADRLGFPGHPEAVQDILDQVWTTQPYRLSPGILRKIERVAERRNMYPDTPQQDLQEQRLQHHIAALSEIVAAKFLADRPVADIGADLRLSQVAVKYLLRCAAARNLISTPLPESIGSRAGRQEQIESTCYRLTECLRIYSIVLAELEQDLRFHSGPTRSRDQPSQHEYIRMLQWIVQNLNTTEAMIPQYHPDHFTRSLIGSTRAYAGSTRDRFGKLVNRVRAGSNRMAPPSKGMREVFEKASKECRRITQAGPDGWPNPQDLIIRYESAVSRCTDYQQLVDARLGLATSENQTDPPKLSESDRETLLNAKTNRGAVDLLFTSLCIRALVPTSGTRSGLPQKLSQQQRHAELCRRCGMPTMETTIDALYRSLSQLDERVDNALGLRKTRGISFK